jgi:hypothetical protein
MPHRGWGEAPGANRRAVECGCPGGFHPPLPRFTLREDALRLAEICRPLHWRQPRLDPVIRIPQTLLVPQSFSIDADAAPVVTKPLLSS